MKTPLDPMRQDLADARGIETRRKRDEELRSARSDTCDTEHPLCGSNGTETLASIERALHRLASGDYGKCLSCGSDISLARLEHNPAVETCETCSDVVLFKAN